MSKILAFAASLSEKSLNMKLIQYAAKELKENGHEVTIIDLKNYPLPVYIPETQVNDFPDNAVKLYNIMIDHSVWLIASPEYNYTITACLKNLIDWISRTPNNQMNLTAYINRVVGLISASPAISGGCKSIRHLREILTNMGSIVVPSQTSIGNAYAAFDEQNNLININDKKSLTKTLQQLTSIAQKFSS
jgi:chromate reductase, NAD(P)H dehydrogenase (quinone)